MPVTTTVARLATKPFPNFISPRGHAILDYMTAGAFLGMGALLWRRSKRAALSALLCGGAELAVSLFTDYPGGVRRVIDFPTHGKIDAGLATMTATMPEFLAFPDERERFFFLLQGGAIAVVAGLTDFESTEGQRARVSGRKLERAA